MFVFRVDNFLLLKVIYYKFNYNLDVAATPFNNQNVI